MYFSGEDSNGDADWDANEDANPGRADGDANEDIPERDILSLLYLERNLNRKGVPTGNIPSIVPTLTNLF